MAAAARRVGITLTKHGAIHAVSWRLKGFIYLFLNLACNLVSELVVMRLCRPRCWKRQLKALKSPRRRQTRESFNGHRLSRACTQTLSTIVMNVAGRKNAEQIQSAPIPGFCINCTQSFILLFSTASHPDIQGLCYMFQADNSEPWFPIILCSNHLFYPRLQMSYPRFQVASCGCWKPKKHHLLLWIQVLASNGFQSFYKLINPL